MTRRVFFSFHYQFDAWRVNQVRQSWRFRPTDIELPFFDRAGWERVKRQTPRAISGWIDSQLKGSSVTVVLIGQSTWQRPWVNYEIDASRQPSINNGLIGIYINGLQNQYNMVAPRGPNPFDYHFYTVNGRRVPFSYYHKTYDWVSNNGNVNFKSWVDDAAREVGR